MDTGILDPQGPYDADPGFVLQNLYKTFIPKPENATDILPIPPSMVKKTN